MKAPGGLPRVKAPGGLPRVKAPGGLAWEWMRAGGENLVYELVLYVLGLL